MTISAITGRTQATQLNKALAITADDFFKLLVTQIRYQDPLKPMEDKEFMAQTAQFSQLEEVRAVNSWLKTIANRPGTSLVEAAQVIGKWAKAVHGSEETSGKITLVRTEGDSLKVMIGDKLVDAQQIIEIRGEV